MSEVPVSMISLYIDAARSARLSQVVGRARRLVPVSVLARGLEPQRGVTWRPHARGLGVDPAPQSGNRSAPPHETATFAAYGHVHRFENDRFWARAPDDLLFRFHLHGFSPLAEFAAGTRGEDRFWQRVLESWLATQSRPSLPGWHPYPTSLRLIAWTAALSAELGWSHSLKQRLAAEVARQARYLTRSIEYDIGGNHVLRNAAALCFAGSVVPQSGVLPRGLRLLECELARQLLADGGHEELSPSYHRQLVADLSDVRELLRRAGEHPPTWLEHALDSTVRWQRSLAGPDGRLPLLGDAWEGPAIDSEASDLTVLRQSGYVIICHKTDQLIIDAGPLCPPHLPPHAHADCLSFVLWHDGRPVVVDPGSFTYSGPERDAFRGTSAHNTVAVADADQCVFWGPFRAGALPRVFGPRVRRIGNTILVEAAHDGYRRLADPALHQRAFLWWPERGLVVIDRLLCERPQQVSSRLCFAPGVLDATAARAGALVVSTIGRSGAPVREARQYSPELGQREPTAGLLDRRVVAPGEPFGWTLLRAGVRVELHAPDALALCEDAKDPVVIKLSLPLTARGEWG